MYVPVYARHPNNVDVDGRKGRTYQMSQYLQIEITPQLPPDIFTRNPPVSVLVLRVPDGKDVEVAVELTGRVRITTRKNEVSPGGCSASAARRCRYQRSSQHRCRRQLPSRPTQRVGGCGDLENLTSSRHWTMRGS